jgi:hypothetical protein
MTERIQRYRYPNDDGKRQRAWVTDCDERGTSACERVKRVLGERPWVTGVVETEKNGDDDRNGVDIFMEMDGNLAVITGVCGEGKLVTIQVKSSEHEQRKFGLIHKDKIFNLENKKHTFVLDGQDALDVITADLLGQMIVAAGLSKTANEEDFLKFIGGEIGDSEMVIRYRENRELLLLSKWYGPLILNRGDA